MPNWCSNNMEIIFPTKKEKKRFIKESTKELKLKHDTTWHKKGDVLKAFSFDALIPMPKQLEGIHKGMTTINGKKYSHWRVVKGDDGEEKEIPITNLMLEQIQRRHGATNWYDWNLINWGTKWDVFYDDVVLSDHGDIGVSISFETAWSPPEDVFHYIYENFECDIEVEFDEPGVGYKGNYYNGSISVKDYTDEDHKRMEEEE